MEVMERLDTVEKESKKEIWKLNDEISTLKKENRQPKEENRLLGGKAANTYNGREKTGRKAGGQKGHGGTTLTKAEAEERLRSGKYSHRIRTVGDPAGKSSTARCVLYRAMKDKTLDTMHKVRFLEKYTGILVHDHETALYHFRTDHGECNVHIIRYLRKNTEDTGNTWSVQMVKLLSEMNRVRKTAKSRNETSLAEPVIRKYEKRYDGLITAGRAENKKTKHRYAKKEEKALLNRMEKYRHNHLLFLYDFRVPFDDNMSGRDLRKAKNRQKMAGGFRKTSGHEMYCNILTIIETLKRRKMAVFENIKMLFMGTPAIF